MYQVASFPLPRTDADVQALINTTVPPAMKLISVSVYQDGGAAKILIVFA
jgi:hypothetical protein